MECQREGSSDGGQRAWDRSQRARGAPGPYHSLAVWPLASYRAFTSSSENWDQYLLLLLIHGACEGSEEIISLKVSKIEKHLTRIHILCHLTSRTHCLPCFSLCSVFHPCRSHLLLGFTPTLLIELSSVDTTLPSPATISSGWNLLLHICFHSTDILLTQLLPWLAVRICLDLCPSFSLGHKLHEGRE